MSVLFACPYCQAETMVDDAYVGQSGPCATCGRVITVAATPGAQRTSVPSARPAQKLNLTSIGVLIGVVVVSLIAGVLLVGGVVSLLIPAVTAARLQTNKAQSGEKLVRIAQALEQYRADKGHYPPAFVLGSDGKPWHSWRVLILPQLGHQDLYNRYDFNSKWDSPNNQQLVREMPDVFASPTDENAKIVFDTSYLAVVGPTTVFPGEKSTKKEDITDGPERTILIVESTESGIGWMEPRDLSTARMSYTVNGAKTDCIRSNHPLGASVVFADGQAYFMPNDTPPDVVAARLSIKKNDNSAMELFELNPR